MAVAVGDIVRITAKLLLDNLDDIINVYHFAVAVNTAANDTQFMDETATALDTLYALINGAITTRVSYSSVEGQNITKDELLPSRPWPSLVAGINAFEMLPEMVSACVFHRTLKPRVRCSKFLPPFCENNSDGGAIVPITVTNMQAYGDSLNVGLTEPNIALVYVAFNRVTMGTQNTTQALVPNRFRTQRRRRLGVGS